MSVARAHHTQMVLIIGSQPDLDNDNLVHRRNVRILLLDSIYDYRLSDDISFLFLLRFKIELVLIYLLTHVCVV